MSTMAQMVLRGLQFEQKGNNALRVVLKFTMHSPSLTATDRFIRPVDYYT
jgi:hypothetical protein